MNAGEHLVANSALAAGTAWQLLTNPKEGGTGGGLVVNDGVYVEVPDLAISVELSAMEVEVELAEVAVVAEVQDQPIAIEVSTESIVLEILQ